MGAEVRRSRPWIVLASIAYVSSIQLSWAAQPYVEPQDSIAALQNPDLYAWKLFVALNWPAAASRREADPARRFGENDVTVWESWKLSSGPNDEVFLSDGRDPGPWLGGAFRSAIRPLESLETLPKQQAIRAQRSGIGALFDPPTSTRQRNENHLNMAAYEFIRNNELYHIGGQEKIFQAALDLRRIARDKYDNDPSGLPPPPYQYRKKLIDFPAMAKEVKAQWRPISETDKPRYRWVEFVDGSGARQLYGLTALHITTKDLPNWLWATFEHIDNEKRSGAEPHLLSSNDSSAGQKGYPEGLGIEGTRWENYRLRGTQIDFVDSTGSPTLLANSQIEEEFQTSSSCITCHAMASIGARRSGEGSASANRLAIFLRTFPRQGKTSLTVGPVGHPDPGLFEQYLVDDDVIGELTYLQTDFVWSLFRAKRKP